MIARLLSSLAVLLLAGCASLPGPVESSGSGPVLKGTITYVEGFALPKGARVHLAVFAAPRGNETSKPITQTSFLAATPVPIAFELPVPTTKIDAAREYVLIVQIISTDVPWFSNALEPARVLTLGAPTENLTILLRSELR